MLRQPQEWNALPEVVSGWNRWGKIPDAPEGTTFDRADTGRREVPAAVLGWEYSETFNRWGAVVRYADGFECLTYPNLEPNAPATAGPPCPTCGLENGEHYNLCPLSPNYYSPEREKEDALRTDNQPSDFPPFDPVEEYDGGEPACSNPAGHKWAYTGTAYGGDDPRWCGEGRCLCIHCGADGDA